MPVINIQWLEGRSQETRRELVRVLTDDVVRIAECPREAVHIVITDVPKDHWATAGTLRSDG